MEDGKVMIKLNVLYEDNHIIVVEKPVNMLSQADSTGDIDLLSLVKEYIKEKYNKPGNVYIGLVHRLDRPVGGVMVFARTSKAAARLSKDIRDHKFYKEYLAIINGKLEDSGTFSDRIEKLKDGMSKISDKGKESMLDYKVLDFNKNTKHTLVSILLKTGRHHQIRLQFASRGFYLCGDQRYGKKDNTQLALFAYKLKFIHPTKKVEMEFSIIPPQQGYWTEFTV